jgi:hypothetical protein
MCCQTTALNEFAYGKRKCSKSLYTFEEIDKICRARCTSAAPWYDTRRQHAKSDTNILTGTSGHTTLTVLVLFKMVDYGGTILLTLLSPRRVPYGLQSLNQTLFFL